ncbi:MAG TPA: RluA family pseudouridine synthase [Micropepsaceae bacterium]|nr:RluA family pseudouridine synthase [Micropepsaceae bacterium]
MSRVQTLKVEADDAGSRLDRWFKRHFPGLKHGHLEKLLRTGQVRVDGARAEASTRVEKGQAIRVPPLPENVTEPSAEKSRPSLDIKEGDEAFIQSLVLYKDDAVMVINKPHGLATQGGPGITRHLDGMLDFLRFGKKQRPRLVHRLDRDTSGVLVLARTVPAAAALAEAFRARETRKVYWALVAGVPKPHQGTIKLALAKVARGPNRTDEHMIAVRKGEPHFDEAKHAITHYALMGRAASELSWLAMMPVTGRTHQLRAHAAAIGTPIMGDRKYGGDASKLTGAAENKLHLHARRIVMKNPSGGVIEVTAPLPPHMRHTWSLFGFDANDKRDPFREMEE